MKLSMADAAYTLLKEAGKPLHYALIVNQLIARQLISTKGLTPGASLLAVIAHENAVRNSRGELPRFDVVGNGFYGLVEWRPVGIERQIQEINRKTRGDLQQSISKMPPASFEELIGKLLIQLGFDEETVEVTGRAGDGGIDVIGVMDIEGVARFDVAVQVKRVKSSISPEKIRALRGSLLPHQRGIFVTTSSFTTQAIGEANAVGKFPISLVDGDGLLDLLFKHNIGVVGQQHVIYELDPNYWLEPPIPTSPPDSHPTNSTLEKIFVSYPLRIFVRYETGDVVEATLLETGEVFLNEQTYRSVSAAGMAVTGWKSCNGWNFWWFVNPTDNQEYLIDVLR